MKIKVTIKKVLLVISIIIILSANAFSQNNSYIKNRWNFKAGYSRYVTGIRINNKNETIGNLRLACNYGVTNLIETGIYIGYSNFEFITDTSYKQEKYFTPFYGINVNFHLLPLIIKADDFRFDLYITGKFGGRYFTTPDNCYWHGHYSEYGIGSGFSFYFLEHFGFYAEYCLGKFHFREAIKDITKLRYGLTIKF
jgi:hypothetical protein